MNLPVSRKPAGTLRSGEIHDDAMWVVRETQLEFRLLVESHEAGNIEVETKAEYDSDPVRFRHGKETLKQFSKLVEAEWRGTRDVVMRTDSLYVEELAPPDKG